jgi:hypothetical protein
MPKEHAQLIASWVAVSGQLYAFSDWLPTLSEERVDIIRKTIRPHGLTTARPVDLFNEQLPKIWLLTQEKTKDHPRRDIVAFYNWDDKKSITIESTPQWLGLPEANEYVTFDFWGNKFLGTFKEKISVELPPASCLILAVRPVETHPFVLSTSQHVTQGIVDVISENWNPETKELSGESNVVFGDEYELRIYNPVTKEIKRETFNPKTGGEKKYGKFEWKVKM